MRKLLWLVLFFITCKVSFANNYLIQTPTARFDNPNDVKIGIFTKDNINGIFSSYQLGKHTLIKALKYKDNNLNEKNEYKSSIDLKFLLKEESEKIPQIAIGINNISGNEKDLEAEYISFSKKINNFDIHAGIGWGSLGAGRHIKNPFSFLGNHFQENDARNNNSRPESLFTGKKAGLFGGISYNINPKFKLNLEYNDKDYAKLYHSSKNKDNVSIGFDYNLSDSWTISPAFANMNRFMAKVSYKFNTNNLKPSYKSKVKEIQKMRNNKVNLSPGRMILKANKKGINAHSIKTTQDSTTLWINTTPLDNTKQNILDATKFLYQNTSNKIKNLGVIQTTSGLDSNEIIINRTDLEENPNNLPTKPIIKSSYKTTPDITYNNFFNSYFFINPTIDADLSTTDESYRYNSSIIAGIRNPNAGIDGWNYGFAFGYNLKNNLSDKWYMAMGRGTKPDFANEKIFLENLYARKTYRPFEELFIDVQSGYLEEMYTGLTNEIIYRPIDKNWAIGANYDLVFQRIPGKLFDYMPSPTETYGFSVYYEPEIFDKTYLKLSYNKYLGEDKGLSFSAKKKFDSGTNLEFYSKFSNYSNKYLQNTYVEEDLRADAGIKISHPINFLGKNNTFNLNITPLTLLTAQKVKKPENLYDDLMNLE